MQEDAFYSQTIILLQLKAEITR